MCWQLLTVAMVESKQQVMWSLVQVLAKQSTTLCIDGLSIVQLVVQHIGWKECWLAWWSAMVVMVVCMSHLGRRRENTATRLKKKDGKSQKTRASTDEDTCGVELASRRSCHAR